MKILVLSDSHSAISFMRQCMDSVRPDAVIHLGDHYDDGEVLAEEYPQFAGLDIGLPDEKNRRVGQSIAAASLPANVD